MALLNWTDYAVLGVIGFSTIMSLTRGFIREAFSLITWMIAAWVAIHFVSDLANLLVDYIHSPSLRMLASFSILFIITLLLGSMVSYLITRLISVTGLTGTDRLLGIGFGVARGLLIITVFIILARLTPMPEEDWWQSSVLIPYFYPLEIWLQSILPESIRHYLIAK